MKVQPFTCKIDNLGYKTFKNKFAPKSENADDSANADEQIYLCNTTVSEIGRGLAKFPQKHNIVFYLTKEQYEDKVLEKGDRINIFDTAKWKSSQLEYKSYKKELIEKADKSRLKSDNEGRTYYIENVFAYKVECKQGTFEIDTKWYDVNYCTIYHTGLRLPLEDKKQFKKKTLEFYLDDNEMATIETLNGKEVKLVAYSSTTKFAEKTARIEATVNDNGDNYLELIEIETGETESES